MPESSFQEQGIEARGRSDAPHDLSPNLSLVLIAATSKVNRVVVSRIMERAGLKTVTEAPEDAAALLDRLRPGIVILDGGADNRECDLVLERLAGQRRASRSNLPRVILLTTRNGTPETLAPGKLVDAVVAKPITPERLQPLVGRMVEEAREPQ